MTSGRDDVSAVERRHCYHNEKPNIGFFFVIGYGQDEVLDDS